jgi:hypothetical protein
VTGEQLVQARKIEVVTTTGELAHRLRAPPGPANRCPGRRSGPRRTGCRPHWRNAATRTRAARIAEAKPGPSGSGAAR